MQTIESIQFISCVSALQYLHSHCIQVKSLSSSTNSLVPIVSPISHHPPIFPSTISSPPSPIIPRPTPPLPRLLLHIPPTPSQRLRKRNLTRSRPHPPMHQIRAPIQTQPFQSRRIDNIRLRMVVISELAVVFDDAVFVPVALRCLKGVNDPGLLI
jgi:hypothetical protein